MLVPWRVQFQLYPNYKRKHPTSVKRSHVRAGCALFGRNGGTRISGAYLFVFPTWDPRNSLISIQVLSVGRIEDGIEAAVSIEIERFRGL